MIKLPDDFSEIRIKKAKLWIDRVMLDMPGMKEAKTCAAILEFVAEVQRLNATAQPVSDAVNDVLAERQRQQMVEGWTTKHDDQYRFNELAIAGGLYALNAHDSSASHFRSPPGQWPWNAEWWKPKSPRKDLVRAAALIIAEIERIDRLAAAPELAPPEKP